MGKPFSLIPTEPGKFLNREQQLRAGVGEFQELRRNPLHFKVLEVHGYGGMGKTRLLQRLREIAEADSPPDYLVRVALEADVHAKELGPLIRIRDQLDLECLLFDTALITFWHETGQRLHLELSSRLARSLPVQAFQAAGAASGHPLPLGFAIQAFHYAKQKLAKVERYDQEEFEAIAALRETPGEIRRFLPNYLGVDIERALGPREEFVAFYDAFEKQRLETRLDSSSWLPQLLTTLERGVHIISTREPLPWTSFAQGVIERVDVGVLPEDQSLEMIRSRLGDLDENLQEHFLEASHRIPFFLETVVENYERRSLAGDSPTLDSLPSSPDDSVDHLLEHLPEDQRKLVVMLSTLQVFDQYVFECLVRELNLSLDALTFDSFVGQFFVEDLGPDLYKTHDLLTDFVRKSEGVHETRRVALQAISEDFPLHCRATDLSDPYTLLALLSAAVSGWYSVEDAPLAAVEALVDAGYLLYDAGYWDEVGALPSKESHPVAAMADFFSVLALRRNEGAKAALELFGELEGRTSALGRHARSAELEVAYLTELTGDYAEAREMFASLEGQISRFDPGDRLHLRLRLYHADMLTMDGNLQEASRLLAETYENDAVSKVDWIELVRHRGHAFRFSFLFETAEELYGRALRGAEEMESVPLQAKLWTNLAETACWHDPERALEAASHAVELNGKVRNRFELAKCAAAQAIALAKLGEERKAGEALENARGHASQVNYRAGSAFALQAECVLLGLQAEMSSLETTLSTLEATLKKLDTYSHLRVAPVWLTRSEAGFAEASTPFEWLEPEELEARLRNCLGS